MADIEEIRARRQARADLTKHGIDTARADVQIRHGILTIRGIVKAMPGSNIPDVKVEMERISRVLRQKAHIREVVLDCIFNR